jgi:hypothetical protein
MDERRSMTPEQAEEYTDALGQVASGAWRQVALGVELGVPNALGLSTGEWVEQRLGGYVRLSMEARREAARELTAPEDEGGRGMSQRKAAEVLGVAPDTVNRDVRDRTPEPGVEQVDPPEPVRDRTPEPDPAVEAERRAAQRREQDRADRRRRDLGYLREIATGWAMLRHAHAWDPAYRDGLLAQLNERDAELARSALDFIGRAHA